MTDVYLRCPDCGQDTLLDSGPLGLNCFSDSCVAESKALARKLMNNWRRQEAARLLALADADE